MALKIRLRQQGRNNRPFFRVVVADCRSPRDGKYIEAIGWYNPFAHEESQTLLLKDDRVQYWLNQGAILTETTKSLVSKVAPSVLKQHTDRIVALRAKEASKRKARKKKKEG